MPAPKIGEYEGRTTHYSVGALIVENDKILLLDRVSPPFGLAGPAGHVDEGENTLTTLNREVFEETGLKVVSHDLIVKEFVPWNTCSKQIEGHSWELYRCVVAGELKPNHQEAKTLDWYPLAALGSLAIEPVWQYWLQKLGYLSTTRQNA